ncbi:dihydroorotase family protein [Candidatus Woesearchaeota archaeon]|nr:dihydroorotase family protein [Candidatus Woesearchaeota archaeon]
MKLLIKNATIYEKNKPLLTDILVEEGVISKIEQNINLKANKIKVDKIIDATGLTALPGMIDLHVHCREPGATHKEDFLTASHAAVAGGITTFFDMPNNSPTTSTIAALEEKRLLAKKAVVNYGFNFGLVKITENIVSNDVTADKKQNNKSDRKSKNDPKKSNTSKDKRSADKQATKQSKLKIDEQYNLEEAKESQKFKCVRAVKVYLGQTTGNLMIDDLKVLEHLFLTTKIVMLHIEDDKLEEVLELFSNYCKKNAASKTALYICHVNSKKMVELIKRYKKQKHLEDKLFCEVTPHHLFLNNEDAKMLGRLAYVKPLILTKDDQKALWRALEDGTIDVIATDHAPHTLEEKNNPDITKVPAGMPGLETALPLLLNAVHEGQLAIGDVIRLYSTSPAKIFGLKKKGRLKEGNDADIVLAQQKLRKRIINDNLLTKCKWNAFSNRELFGVPVYTLVNGNLVYEYDKFTDKKTLHDIKGKEVE